MLEKLSEISIPRAALFGIIIGALYYFIGYNDGSTIVANIVNKENEIKALEARRNRLDKTINEVKNFEIIQSELGDKLEKAKKYIPKKTNAVTLMRKLSSEAKLAGTNILNITEGTRNMVDGAFFEKLSISVRLQGTYGQLLTFMSYMTKVDQIVTVSNINMRLDNAASGGESKMLSFTGLFSGYSYVGEDKK